jgi:hypothetical protein
MSRVRMTVRGSIAHAIYRGRRRFGLVGPDQWFRREGVVSSPDGTISRCRFTGNGNL